MQKKATQKSLAKWTKQKWRTPSGKPSLETGEVYAPSAAIAKLKTSKEGRERLAKAVMEKREAMRKGEQYSEHGLHEEKEYANFANSNGKGGDVVVKSYKRKANGGRTVTIKGHKRVKKK
jgi:hypothetical protein